MFNPLKLTIILLLGSLNAFAVNCDSPMMKDEICFKMRHLRSQMMALGEQRELMQVNYPYLAQIGEEVLYMVNHIDPAKLSEMGHPEGIETLKESSTTLINLATKSDPLALSAANTLQKKCATCHKSSGPDGGSSWDKIFRHDWDQVAKNCNQEGRLPYLCKSMNGMLSAYATALTGPNADRRNFESLRMSTDEIVRISTDLKSKKMFHGSEESMNVIQEKAQRASQLAFEKNDSAFSAALEITNGCMECHGSRFYNSGMDKGLQLNQL